ncbi:DUF4350 domain-containing protein [Novosphingobium sp. KCTC 2891]|uniref:DUF4350 domain-containing protein n=1 Tax=Novosphingobium sp. KCTC 2891 TaxID=2989730 RepID=UPI00222174FF|nr:DUF4350 domain-containing protein [Novosphingobium sp. KCTC 2891]MCW1383336.1 DUF4350 domain-containing protein [Novosphingobium sp. KCTC 2891]
MNAPPFARGTVIGMLLVGSLAFLALLWSLGHDGGNANNGGGHVGGRGLNGFAALAAMLEADGYEVRRARSISAADGPGLLVLTPPADAKGSDIAAIVLRHRHVGPTLVVTPKWIAAPIGGDSRAQRGWTAIVGAQPPQWPGFADDVSVSLAPARGWRSGARGGALPMSKTVLSGSGPALVPLVRASDGRVLAAFVGDAGHYSSLERLAGIARPLGGDDTSLYPLVFVFEPDLLDNWGMADRATGLAAHDLIAAAAETRTQPVTFDLTLNGLGGARNLLTLAFEPPFLAATICLVLAMAAAAWRGMMRFGPPRVPPPALAHGKTALVANAAGLIRRSGRLHLVAAPYANAVRERLVAALGLPKGRASAATDAAIDRVQQSRGSSAAPFSSAAARLSGAHKSHDVARFAAELHAIEKDLTR